MLAPPNERKITELCMGLEIYTCKPIMYKKKKKKKKKLTKIDDDIFCFKI